MAGSTPLFLLSLLLTVSLSSRALSGNDQECVFTVFIRTGSILKAGTDSKISLTLYTANGDGVLINDLEAWGGIMEKGHDYFERGNLDIFSGRGPCLSEIPVCSMNLTSDGLGAHHGCNYVEVTTTGPHGGCHQEYFEVEQWLATDASPYELTAIRQQCGALSSGRKMSLGRVGGEGGEFQVLKAVV